MPFIPSTPAPIRPTQVGQSGNLQILQRLADALTELRTAGLLIGNDLGSGGGTTDPGYDIILLIGQSNMSGRGTPVDSSGADAPNARIFQYGSTATGLPNTGTIYQASDPLLMHDNNTEKGVGPAMTFAKLRLASMPAERKILLVPAAHGGTALSTTTTPLGWRRGVSGNLYAQALTQLNAAINAANGQGGRNAVIVALWVQGEQDGAAAITKSQYSTDLDNLINGLRTDISNSTLPFVIGQMVPEYLWNGTRAAINEAQAEVGSRVSRAAFAPYPGPANQNKADGNHYNPVGNRALGQEMYATFQRLIAGVAQPTIPSAPTAPANLQSTTGTSTSLTIAWDAVTAADSYTLTRRAGLSGSFSNVAVLTSPSYVDTGLTTDQMYQYQVYATNKGGPSVASTTLTATPTSAVVTPTAPSISVTPGSNRNTVNGSSSGATSYDVYRSATSGAVGAKTKIGDGVSMPYTDLTASNGTTYYYQLTAKNSAGTSPASIEASGTPTAATTYSQDFTTLPSDWTNPSAAGGTFSVDGNGYLRLTGSSRSGGSSHMFVAPDGLPGTLTGRLVRMDVMAAGTNTTNPQHPRIILDYVDEANQTYAGYDTSAGAWQIRVVVGGVETIQATTASVPSAPYSIELRRIGSTYTLYSGAVGAAPDTLRVTMTGASSTGTRTGIRIRAGGGSETTALQAEAQRADNFYQAAAS